MNKPIAQHCAELWAIRKIAPTAVEMALLANQFSNAAKRLEIATTDENFAVVEFACREMDDISDKITYLNYNLKRVMQDQTMETMR